MGSWAVGGTNSSWALGDPTRGPGSAHSGSNAWATGLAVNYNNDEDSTLTSPVDIDLTAAAGEYLQLSWWQWLQTESGYDFASVEVSDDGGVVLDDGLQPDQRVGGLCLDAAGRHPRSELRGE